jgi:hypothetical protein
MLGPPCLRGPERPAHIPKCSEAWALLNGLQPASFTFSKKIKKIFVPVSPAETIYMGSYIRVTTTSCACSLFVKAKRRKQITNIKKSFKNLKDFFNLSRKNT